MNHEAHETIWSGRIEKKILSGEIRTDRSNPTYPVFSYLPAGWTNPLPLMNASSMVVGTRAGGALPAARGEAQWLERLLITSQEAGGSTPPPVHADVELVRLTEAAVVEFRRANNALRPRTSEWMAVDELANLVRLSVPSPQDSCPDTLIVRTGLMDPRDVGVWLPSRRAKVRTVYPR